MGSRDTIMNQRLLNSCSITHQTLATNCYLIYVGSVFKISRKKNETSLRFKNFRLFHTFVLHYESAELAES